MAKRYRHYCAVARALDMVGERWTLLVVRQLLPGARRFNQLLDGLPGIGTNVLSDRLKELENRGLVQRRLDGGYALTPLGQELELVISALARWGMNFLDEPDPEDAYRPEWLLTGLRGTFDPAAAAGLHETYEIRVDDFVFHATVEDGTLDLVEGPAREPTLVANLDAGTLLTLGTGRLSAREAVRIGAVHLLGDQDAFGRCVAVLNGNRKIPAVQTMSA